MGHNYNLGEENKECEDGIHKIMRALFRTLQSFLNEKPEELSFSCMLLLVDLCVLFGDDEEDFHLRLKIAKDTFSEVRAIYLKNKNKNDELAH
jgi:hypothetical protein